MSGNKFWSNINRRDPALVVALASLVVAFATLVVSFWVSNIIDQNAWSRSVRTECISALTEVRGQMRRIVDEYESSGPELRSPDLWDPGQLALDRARVACRTILDNQSNERAAALAGILTTNRDLTLTQAPEVDAVYATLSWSTEQVSTLTASP